MPPAWSYTCNGPIPYYDPSEVVVYDVNFIKYLKYLMSSENLAFIFKIDPKFLESFPRSNLNTDDQTLKNLMEESNVDKWPILKLYPPDCWDDDTLDEKLHKIREDNGDDQCPINLMGVSCDQIIKEAKIMNRLSSSQSFKSSGIPKVIVSGVMRDVSKKESPDKFSILSSSFHGGFILMNDVGKSLKDDEMRHLDDETKRCILDLFKKMHELDVVHGDVRAENILLKSEEASTDTSAASIIDFGNAIITKDKHLKGRDQAKIEELLGL